ncbi:hypothetical protein [Paractinoplanes brasiliensis]|nr:hypothetical protein [Actinoplanes brasiliensis]GID26831.1 hypothetical protein Abr02nite_18140 [Actinoplanes brasiliensis]
MATDAERTNKVITDVLATVLSRPMDVRKLAAQPLRPSMDRNEQKGRQR